MSDDANPEYTRGHREGGQDARMAAYDIHFRSINGSVKDTGEALIALSSVVEGLRGDIRAIRDRMDAEASTRIATAQALKDQVDQKRDMSSDSWAPYSRWLTVVSVIVAVAAIAYAIYTHK
jgi:hypothetical protein